MAWIAGIGLALGAMGSMSASKDAKKAQQAQEALTDRSMRISESQEARSNQLWREHQTTYLPRERELVAKAFSEEDSPEAAAARATSNVRQIATNNREMSLRNARRLGINPTSGAYAALDNSRQLGEMGLEAAARDNARRDTKETNFQRQHSVLSLGRNLPATAAALSGQAQSGVQNSLSLASRQTADANATQAAAGQQMGYYAGQLSDWYRRRNTGAGAGSGTGWADQASAAQVS